MIASKPVLLLLPLLALAATPAHAKPDFYNGLDSSLTIYMYPPRNPLDWTTPSSILRTTMGNLASLALTRDGFVHFINDFHENGTLSSHYKSSIGHTINHVRCKLPDGTRYDHWASLSGQDYTEVDTRLLNKEKIGMGMLFYDYVDGHIIEGAENVKRVTFYTGDRDGDEGRQVRPRYIQLELTAEQCQAARDMIAFFEGFHFKPGTPIEQLEARGTEKTLYFTNNLDPYESYVARSRDGKGRVGGGCAPFAAGLLKVTGRFAPELDKLWRTPVTVSEKLIGGQRYPNGQVHRVGLFSLLLGPVGSRWDWSNEGWGNRHLSLYDPQKIWDFTGDVLECLASGTCEPGARAVYRGHKAELKKGVTQVFRDTYSKPVPQDGLDIVPVVQPVQGFVWRLPAQ